MGSRSIDGGKADWIGDVIGSTVAHHCSVIAPRARHLHANVRARHDDAGLTRLSCDTTLTDIVHTRRLFTATESGPSGRKARRQKRIAATLSPWSTAAQWVACRGRPFAPQGPPSRTGDTQGPLRAFAGEAEAVDEGCCCCRYPTARRWGPTTQVGVPTTVAGGRSGFVVCDLDPWHDRPGRGTASASGGS